jgi:outer membrane protein
MNMQKKVLAGLFATALTLSISSAYAIDKGDYIVRVGVSTVSPMDDSNELTGFAGSEVGVGSATTMGFTIGKMLTDNISLEMLGVYPSSHSIKGKSGAIAGLAVGDVQVFPPTFHANYYFNPQSDFRVRVGAGFSTVFYLDPDVAGPTKAVLGTNTELEIDHTIGLAANVGLDYDITENFMLSMGVWYVDFDADATLTTGATSRNVDIEVDPIVTLFGLGYRF